MAASAFREVTPSTEPLATSQVCDGSQAYLQYLDPDGMFHTLPVEITDRCRTLSGHVYDADGNPMAGVPIWIEPQTDFDWNGYTSEILNPNHFPNGRVPIIHYASLGFVARTDENGRWSAVVPNFADDFLYGRTWPGFCAGGGVPFNWLDCARFRGYAVAPFSGLTFPIYRTPGAPPPKRITRGDGVSQSYDEIILAERGDTAFSPRYRDSIFVQSGDRDGLDFYGVPDLRVIARTAPDLESPGVLQGMGFTVEGNGIAPKSVTTNANGFADISQLEPGTYTVTADHAGLFDQDQKQVTVPERGGAEVTFTERPSLVISLWSINGAGPGVRFPVELRVRNLSPMTLNDLVVEPLTTEGSGLVQQLSGPV
ncbi:MAG TPA: carboxypeptidase-like regulatory domain-containing protein, partial [Tepidiformaceae bacterium]|nr:carboxypeptidase-like regulatory domain-containing protein [Tepidiformaceae bacterium]